MILNSHELRILHILYKHKNPVNFRKLKDWDAGHQMIEKGLIRYAYVFSSRFELTNQGECLMRVVNKIKAELHRCLQEA